MNNDLNKDNSAKKITISMIFAFLSTIGMQGVMAMPSSENILYSNSIFSFFVFIIISFCMFKLYDEYTLTCKRDNRLSLVFSILFSLALHFGARMEAVDNVRFNDLSLWIHIISLSIAFTPILCVIVKRLPLIFKRSVVGQSYYDKDFKFFQIWGIIFLTWLPTFLALYPGAFVYDAQDEYIEVISRSFTMHHPLLHVLTLGGIVHAAEYLGLSANIGIATYVIIQMMIMSAILAYGIKLFEKWGIKRYILLVIMAFYSLFPLFPMYAVCTAKDGLFTAFFYLIILLLIDYIRSIELEFFSAWNMILFVASSTLMMLYRNNGRYAYIVAIPFIYLIARNNSVVSDKADGKRISSATRLVILMLLSIILYAGINYTLKTVTHASDEEYQEMLTVPIQQIARVYAYSKDTFLDDELEMLYEVIPEEYLNTYNLRVSDIIKSGFNNKTYASNPSKFRRLWMDIGLRKPLIYINAWFGTSYGYWYPDAINNVYAGNQMFTFQYGDSSYFGFETEAPGYRDSKFSLLELLYRKMSLSLFQQKVPVLSMLFAPGFVFWLFAFIILAIIRNAKVTFMNNKIKYNLKSLIPIIPVAFIWLTVLLGPTTLVRYVLILWYIIPAYIPIILFTINEEEK